MISYIAAVRRGFRDIYGFEPLPGLERSDSPIFPEGLIPDGTYPMEIGGDIDYIGIIDGKINCCNFLNEVEGS